MLGFVRAVVHLCVFTSLLGFSLSIFAQSDPMAPDARPFAPIEGGEIDSISTVNHGLQIHAPVWSIKQRGNLSLSFTLRYNSPSFTKFHDCSYPGKPCVDTYEFQGNGVAFKSSTDVSVSPDVYEPTGSNGQPVFQGYYWIVTTPDSGTHKLAAIGNGNYRAIDATGWLFNEQTFVLTSKDGVSYHYSGQAPTSSIPYPLVFRLLYIEDTNGNRITLNYSSYVSGGVTYYTLSTYTDSFGRTVAAVPTATTDYSGCTGQNPVASAGLWTPPGASSPIKFCSANVVIQTNFFGGAPATKGSWPTEVEAYADPSFLQSVVLPDGTSWTFQYTPLNNSTYNYGELTKVTLPTGGNLSYQWVEDYRVCPNTANQNTYRSEVSSRSVDANDGNGPQTWIYGTATINGQTVPATTDPLGNKTVHTIASVSGNCSLYETQTDYYDNQNNKLRTDTTSYQTLPIIDVFPGETSAGAALPHIQTIKWANGVTKTTTYQYDSGFSGSGFSAASGGTQTGTFPYGSVTTKTESDYVTNGTAGSTLRTTVTNYWAFQNSTALSYNMLDRPSSIAVTDGNTGQTTTTTYGYDENSLVSGNASTGWDSNPPNGNTRGNQTSVNRYWDTNNITLTTSKTYTDTGLLSSISEPNNPSISPAAKTSYDYSSSYDGGFVTKITDALGHASQYEYDLDSSNLTGATDVNNQKTSYSYNDPMLRLTGISHPGGDHNLATSIGYSYPDANTVVRTEVLNTSPQQIIQTDTTRYDGLGRETQAQHSDAEGDVYVDTTYDGLGRKYTETTPYRSTSDTQFYGKTTYSYDAFGRITQIQHPDQTTATFQYVGATTLTTNESNGSTQTQKLTKVDGLGRLIDVCEVTSKNPPVTSDTPSACGLEISETGFLTTYTQTLRGITKIQQGAQTRSFSYDSLSQLTDSTNPETGHIHYVYDNDGNVTSKTIPAPNDPPGSTNTLTIGYKYNSLHHLTQKTYSGSGPSATTPASTYNYSEASVDGKDLANPINRLTSEFTTLNGMVQAKSVYSYDTDGRIASHFQCVTNCGSYQDVEYHYDGQGNVASFSTPQLGYTNTYNDAGHLITITPNWTADANHPATLANIHYAPNGGWSSANFGSGVAETYSYSPRWLNSMQVSGLEVTTPPANATATITVTGSEASKQVQSSAPTAATGTVAVSGSERVNSNAVAASGTIVVNGSEQSKQVQSQGPTSSSGSVTVQGSEWTHKMCPEPNHCSTQWDTGAVYLTVNGYQVTAYFGQGSTTSSVASALSTALNVAGSPVSASASGAAVTFTSRATGSSTNYAVSASWTTNANDSEDTYTHSTDFTISPTSLAMSGGQDAQYRTVYDSGTLTVSVNGYSKSTSFGQGSTSASVASALAPQFSCTGGAPASGSPSGSNIVFTACTAGAAANSYAVASSASFDSGDFSSSSFTTSGTQLSGGKDQVWDQGTVTLTLPSGFVASASYGQNDTASSVAGKLYTALSSSSSPVTATNPGSGTAITLTTKATGASANGNIQIAVSGNYSGASDFSASSGGLTGGKNAGMTTVYDLGAVKLTVGGQSVSVNYGQTSTPSTLAQLLVSAVNSSSLPVTAQQNSASIILKAKQSGAAANGTAVSLNATTSDPTDFSSASFGGSPASTSLANGVTAVYTTETIYSFSLQHNPDTQIKQSADSANGTWNYTYDDFNRLISANEVNGSGTTINGLSWDYDRYGNRWHQNLTAGIGTSTSMSFDTGSNHANTNLAYDVAGSVRNDTSHSYVFDAENRITQVDGGISYIYDAEGRRVGKTDGTVYVVTPTGEILDELKNGQQVRSEIYAAGHHIATYAGNTTYFMHTDWLGTERARTNAGGVLCEIITSQPFGDGTIKSTPPNAPACDPSPDFFTGKQRDIESNLDDFGARYFSSQWGRWMSPDWAASPEAVPYATLANPQSLNLYAYVGNDPINGEDPDGHARYATGTGCGNSDPTCTIDDFDDPGHVQADKQASSSFDWQNVVDFAEGYVQGIAASVTFGAVGAPSQSDSDSSLAGQTAGTIAAGVLGTETTKAGIGTAGVSLAAEAPTAGVSTATLAAGAGVAAAGAAVQAGAAKNASAIAETVAMRNGGGPKEGSTGGPSAGKKPSEAQRQRILKENGGKCVFCGKPNEHVDHAHPRSRGGNTMEENLQGTCAHCNLQKGAKTTGEYQEWLKDRQ